MVVEGGVRCTNAVYVKSRGWCETHRKAAARNNGAPARTRLYGPGELLTLVHAAAAATGDECIIPRGWKTKERGTRRPMVKLGGRMMPAARAVWTLAHGDPGELHVLHTCHAGDGSQGCITIRHLYTGNNHQNSQDRVKEGRQARGEDHGCHVLTEEQVREIRRRHVPGTGPYNRGNTRELAEEFGVATTTLRNAVSGRAWVHLGKESPGAGAG
ncbi:hypothetical protein [Streptomyces sp. CA-253872]|uniref:hypothetical protein n=1 Tax=Streptomyces sp. CA-253872 TaxID=3240067 RepID=UPI003D94B989